MICWEREAAALVNNEQKAVGRYNVNFSAKGDPPPAEMQAIWQAEFIFTS